MTLRFLRLLACQLLLVLACAQAQAADDVEITEARIEASEDGYKLAASFSFDLNNSLEDLIQHGVDLFFTTEIELTRPRWYWYDDKAVKQRQTIKISYHTFTRQYNINVIGGMQQSFSTLEDAMVLIRRPSRWVIAPKGALKPGEVYRVTLRMFLDRQFQNKLMQVNALNNSQWRLQSKDKKFSYRAE